MLTPTEQRMLNSILSRLVAGDTPETLRDDYDLPSPPTRRGGDHEQ